MHHLWCTMVHPNGGDFHPAERPKKQPQQFPLARTHFESFPLLPHRSRFSKGDSQMCAGGGFVLPPSHSLDVRSHPSLVTILVQQPRSRRRPQAFLSSHSDIATGRRIARSE